MSTTVDHQKPPKKFPPPCWTQEEALALIEAYKERWYALRRGYLRTTDWDAVAASVNLTFPEASPAKTSAQCRHKMEKLRQRYRAEKQRALSYPGRFLSSWFFFESMDAMDAGETGDQRINSGNNVVLREKPNLDVENGVPLRFRTKVSSNGKSRVPMVNSSYLDYGSDQDDDEDDEEDFDDGSAPMFRTKKIDYGSGYHSKAPIDQDFGFRARKFSKMEAKSNPYSGRDDSNSNNMYNGMDWVKVPGEMSSFPSGFRSKSSVKIDRNSNPNLDPKVSKGKRDRSAISDMVSSIRVLGEGFIKMEKMKMEMAKEIEKMRIDMEMKRNTMFLESQHQIVDSFLKGLLEKKQNKKVKEESNIV